MASMLFLCALIVHGGLEVIGRAAVLFVPVFILPVLIFIIFLGPDFELKKFIPDIG